MQKDMVRRGNPLFSTEVSVEDLKENIDRGKMEQNHRVTQRIHQAFEQIQPSSPIPLEHCHQEWKNVTEIISAYYESFMKFITRVPGFSELRLNDQCILSKGCILEVICLSMVSYYDSGTQTITLTNGKTLSSQRSGHNDAIDSLLVSSFISFMEIYSEINLSRTEMALLAALLTLVELRRGLQEPDRVAETRCIESNALITHLNSSRYESKFGRYRYILTNVHGLLKMSAKLKSEFRQMSKQYQAPEFMQDLLDSSEHKIGIFSQRLNTRQTPKASAILQKPPSGDAEIKHNQGLQDIHNQNSMHSSTGSIYQGNQNPQTPMHPSLSPKSQAGLYSSFPKNSVPLHSPSHRQASSYTNNPYHPPIPSASGTMPLQPPITNQPSHPSYIYYPPQQPPRSFQPTSKSQPDQQITHPQGPQLIHNQNSEYPLLVEFINRIQTLKPPCILPLLSIIKLVSILLALGPLFP